MALQEGGGEDVIDGNRDYWNCSSQTICDTAESIVWRRRQSGNVNPLKGRDVNWLHLDIQV